MRWVLLSIYLFAGLAILGVIWLVQDARIHPSEGIMTSWQMVFIIILALALLTMLFKRIRSRLFWEGIFALAVFLGMWYFFLFTLPFGYALAAASALTLLQIFFPIIAIHDLFYLIGCVGVVINFAGWLGPDILLFGLVLFSFYDTVAGPPGVSIEILTSKLVKTGIVPGFVIPSRLRELGDLVETPVKDSVVLLGAGDVILPLTLVAKAAIGGPALGAIVLAGIVVGAVFLGSLRDSHPRAVLPILAAGAALPFVILRAFSLV